MLTAWLSGCATGSFNECPSLFVYSRDQQRSAAEQLEALPPGSAIALMIAHYGVVREEIRECRDG